MVLVNPASPWVSGMSLTVQLVPESPTGPWESNWSLGVQLVPGSPIGPWESSRSWVIKLVPVCLKLVFGVQLVSVGPAGL
jgi:hypothetical protein